VLLLLANRLPPALLSAVFMRRLQAPRWAPALLVGPWSTCLAVLVSGTAGLIPKRLFWLAVPLVPPSEQGTVESAWVRQKKSRIR